jgi:hypothetical protein
MRGLGKSRDKERCGSVCVIGVRFSYKIIGKVTKYFVHFNNINFLHICSVEI